MAGIERLREAVGEIPTAEEIRHRQEQGWKLAAVEWQRETTEDTDEEAFSTPYGLTTREGETVLQAQGSEEEALGLMLRMVVDDRNSLATVAAELNRQGFRTRLGQAWNAIAVFKMLPRVVEVAPRLFEQTDSSVSAPTVH